MAQNVHKVRRHEFSAMGCTAHLTIVAQEPDELLQTALDRLDQLERRWTRFDSSSELQLLVADAGSAVEVSTDTRLLVKAFVAAWRATGAVFDPTQLPALMDAGYIASMLDGRRVTTLPVGVAVTHSLDDVAIDDVQGTVRLPPGLTLDSGGLGKGLAADLVADELTAAGASGVLVELGGDLRVRGQSPAGPGWTISVDDPGGAMPVGRVCIDDGGVATSTTGHRWRHDGGMQHHLIDGGTGKPAQSDVVSATVVAGTAAWAEAFAKLPILLGSADGIAVLDQHDLPGLVIAAGGARFETEAWARVAA